MKWSAAAALVAACVVVGGAMAVSGACIPDLPASPSGPGPLCGDSVIEFDAGETCDPGQGAADATIGNCANCRLVCPDGLKWTNNHCYQLVQSFPFTAPNGRMSPIGRPFLSQLCQEGHLVTFSGEDEFQAVSGFFDASPFWVGLETAPATPATLPTTFPLTPTPTRYVSVAPFEPGWQPMCRGCYAHTNDPNASLPSTPDASLEGGSEDCVIASSADPSVAWHQYPCSSLPQYRVFPFSFTLPPSAICEVEPVGVQWTNCEAGICMDLVKTYRTKRYVYGAKPVSATDAPKECAALGGRLVILQSPDEREQLWRELSRVPMAPTGAWGVWIGLAQVGPRRGPTLTWEWDDGVPDDGTYPSPWAVGQGLGLTGGGTARAFLWHSTPQGPDDTLAHDDQPATTLMPYVCEIAVGSNDAGLD